MDKKRTTMIIKFILIVSLILAIVKTFHRGWKHGIVFGVFSIVYGIWWSIILRKDAKSDNIAEKSKGRCNINMQKIISVCFVVLLVLTGIVVVYVVLHGGTPEVIESVFGIKVLGISWVVLLVVGGFYNHILRPLKLHKAAKSDNIEERREALYELGDRAWSYATSEDRDGRKTHSQRERSKDRAIEYWLEAAELGHEGAMNKLRMAQIRRG